MEQKRWYAQIQIAEFQIANDEERDYAGERSAFIPTGKVDFAEAQEYMQFYVSTFYDEEQDRVVSWIQL